LTLRVGSTCLKPPIATWVASKKVSAHLYLALPPTSHPNDKSHIIAIMAPTKPSKGKTSTKGSKTKMGAKASSKSKSSASKPEGISKNRQKKLTLAKPGGAQKTKSRSTDGRKKKRVYKESELDIPALNGIIPAGIAKPKGVKKGKVFVDDPASMMAIMSVVNAEKEGRIESKITRARQLEEIREAKRVEAEGRRDEKDKAFEERKEGLKKKRRRSEGSKDKGGDSDDDGGKKKGKKEKEGGKYKPRKRVSFG
jgi:60S ribosomal subunit assembly/export protein LOC1